MNFTKYDYIFQAIVSVTTYFDKNRSLATGTVLM